LEYEKYIHNIIEENQIRTSNYDFHVLFDEEDNSYCIKYDIKAPACTATKELKLCTWCFADKYKNMAVKLQQLLLTRTAENTIFINRICEDN
jgi:hypothetical protein